MKKVTIFLILATLISKIVGFGRDVALSYFYGASFISDAFIISTTIPETVFAIIAAGIATNLIPLSIKIEKDEGIRSSLEFTNKLFILIFIISTIIILIVFCFTEQIVKLFASGFSQETLKLAVEFTRISVFSIYFSGAIFILVAFLQIKNSFILPILLTAFAHLVVLIFIIASAKYSIRLIVIGTTLSVFLQFIILLAFAILKGLRFQISFSKSNKYLKQLLLSSIPVMIGVSMAQINILVDRSIASHMFEGGISALNYAHKINGVIHGVFIVSLANIIYPTQARQISNGKLTDLKELISKNINSLFTIIIPITIITIFFSEEIVNLLFNRGSFTASNLHMTSNALLFYSFGLLGWGLTEILVKVFYAMHDTKTSMITAVYALILNIVLNIILSKYLGVGGLALATSISLTFRAVLISVLLKRRLGASNGLPLLRDTFTKVACASLLTAIVSKYCQTYFEKILTQNVAFIFALAIGIILFLVLSMLLRVQALEDFKKYLKSKI